MMLRAERIRGHQIRYVVLFSLNRLPSGIWVT